MNKTLFIIKKLFNKETISYVFFGMATTVVDTIIFIFSNNILNFNYMFSTILAWIFAVLFSYITNKKWVFNSTNYKYGYLIKEMIYFFMSRVFSLAVSLIWMFLCVEIFSVDEFISKILANFFVVIINYILGKFFVFKN